jgi:hypothetical protein
MFGKVDDASIATSLYPRVVIPSQPGLYKTDLHYLGEWPGIHYIAFTKIPQRS